MMTPVRVCVAYATRGRSEILGQVIAALGQQTLAPAQIVVSAVDPSDAASVLHNPAVTKVFGPAGSSAQRNLAAHTAGECDVIVFFDDDFLPHPRWLEEAAAAFRAHPDIGCLTGDLLDDGAKGPGLSFDQASRLVHDAPPSLPAWIRENTLPYGCNMAFRHALMKEVGFDERLVRYGWLEDADIGGAITRRGFRTVQIGAATGVHMGIKRGRVSGFELGYSQVVNPVYLYRKGTMSAKAAMKLLTRNCGSNMLRFMSPEPYIDRRGRLAGNLYGMVNLVLGRGRPERLAEARKAGS